ncbi:MAG TPA: sigma-70 family RNA polymerase sigma factor [Pirellulales bacterium]|nr:sigma-70 family RNA polymerase sigma factor [Pirellulales bacterium]
MNPSEADTLVIERIRAGERDAWNQLIDCYEGRLLAFVGARLADRSACEDIVQETFLGFLTSLPNYDARRPLESWLFTIAAHKLTDHLRRQQRSATLPLEADSASGGFEPAGHARPASSLVRSAERRTLEERALVDGLREMIDHWRDREQWHKLAVAELLFVRGMANREIAARLKISEQTVANQKFEGIERLRNILARRGVSADWFPELQP